MLRSSRTTGYGCWWSAISASLPLLAWVTATSQPRGSERIVILRETAESSTMRIGVGIRRSLAKRMRDSHWDIGHRPAIWRWVCRGASRAPQPVVGGAVGPDQLEP